MSNLQRALWLTLVCEIIVAMTGCVSRGVSAAESSKGWRLGWVDKIVSPDALDPNEVSQLHCPTLGVSDDRNMQAYALIAYTHFRSVKYVLYPVPSTLSLVAGERVRINLLDCTQPLTPL